MTIPPDIRINLTAPFPSLVTGSGPIGIGKQNGNWQVSYNPGALGVQYPPVVSSWNTQFITIYNSANQTFANIPLLYFGSPVLLNVMSANGSANLQDTVSLGLGFNEYHFVFENIVPANNAVSFEMQVQSGGTFQTTTYLNSAGGLTNCIDLLQSATLGNGGALGYCGEVKIYGSVTNTFTRKMVAGRGVFSTSTSTAGAANCAGFWNGGAGTLTGVQFLMSSGNIVSGNIRVYGYI